MNARYKGPLIVSGLLLLSSLALFDSVSKKMEVSRKSFEASSEKLTQEIASSDAKRNELGSSNREHAEVADFLTAWSVYANDSSNVGSIVDRMSRTATSKNLISTRRPTPTLTDYPLAGGLAIVQVVSFTVTGQFPSVIEWLAEIEEAYPFGRPELIQVAGRGGEIEMTIAMSLLVVGTPK